MANSFAAYYGQNYVFRDLQSIVELILLDHSYAKPWSSHPDASKARPMKTIFLPKADEKADQKIDENDFVDVCEEPVVSVSSSITYDVAKAKTVMAECEKHVNFVCSKKTPDTWEEQICRSGWSSKQGSLFDKVIKVLLSLRLARLTYDSLPNEPVLRRIATDKATKRLRQILCLIEWEAKLCSWLHSTLVDGLSIPLLACYLDILQTLRAKAPTLVDRMITPQTSHRRGPAANAEALSVLLKRPWDPAHGLGTQHKQRKLPGSPLLLIVPSGPTTSSGTGSSSKRSRFWHNQLSVLGKVVPVTMHTSNGGSGVTISQCLDHIIGAVRTKVLELRSHYPNRPVILIGWGVGAVVSCQVAMMEAVCAVVCLGFPFTGLDGVRGDVEDPLLEGKTPTLFVIGSHSSLSSQEDLEELRERLKADTSLLVVGGADDQLRLSRAKKKQEGMTQSMVDRLVMDEIGEFLGNVLTSVNNVQPRVDISDVDEIEIRKKKRKRPATHDLSSELHMSTGQPLQPVCKMARGTSKVGAQTVGTKLLLKMPVGHTLGSISGSVHLKDQPSPTKKPRISKSRSKVTKPAAGVVHGPGTLHSSGGTTLPVSQITGQSRITNLQGLTLGGLGRPVPLSSVSGSLASANREQAFVSLATSKGVGGLGAGQSFITIQRTGSPSVIPTNAAAGGLQYVIKPQSQCHPRVPATVINASGGSGSPILPVSVTSTTAGTLRHTTLSQSATSPFSSVLPVKGKLATQTQSHVMLKGSTALPTSLSSSAALAKLAADSTSSSYSRVGGQPGRGFVTQLSTTSQSSTPVFVHVKEGARKLVTQASSVSQLKPSTSQVVNTPQSKPQGHVQKSKFSLVTQVHAAPSVSQSQESTRKFVSQSSAASKPRFVSQVVSPGQFASLPAKAAASQQLTVPSSRHPTFATSARLVSTQVATPASQPTTVMRKAVPTKGITLSSQVPSSVSQGNKKLSNLLRVAQTSAVTVSSGVPQQTGSTAGQSTSSLGGHSIGRLSVQSATPTRTPITHALMTAQGVLSSPSSIQIVTQHPGGGKTQGSQVITIPRTMATNVASGTTTYTIPASLFKQVVSSSMTRPISTLSVKQGVPVSGQRAPTAAVQSRPLSTQQVPAGTSAMLERALTGIPTTAAVLSDTSRQRVAQSGAPSTSKPKTVIITQSKPTTSTTNPVPVVRQVEKPAVVLQPSHGTTSKAQEKVMESTSKPVTPATSTEPSG